MESGLIFPHLRNLNQGDAYPEGARRLKVAGAQADVEASAEADHPKGVPRKALVYAKEPVPQTDTGG